MCIRDRLERKRKQIAKKRVDWAVGITVFIAVGVTAVSLLVMIVSIINAQG